MIKASKEATIDSITQLQPVLTELANSGDAFVKAFHVFLTYPFVDEVVGRDPQVARNLHMGDYTNLSVTLDIDLTEGLPDAPGIPNIPCIELEQIPPLGPLPPASELCEGVDRRDQRVPRRARRLENCEGLPDFLIDEICDQLPIPGLCPGRRRWRRRPADALPTIPCLPSSCRPRTRRPGRTAAPGHRLRVGRRPGPRADLRAAVRGLRPGARRPAGAGPGRARATTGRAER